MRYYSAVDQRTGWSRAADATLFLSLGLALPAAWVGDRQVDQFDTIASAVGTLEVGSAGGFIARVSDPEVRLNEGVDIADESFWGFFRADVDRMKRGFPLTTSQVTREPVVGLTPRQDRAEFRNADVDASRGSEAYEAVREAVLRSDRPEALAVAEYFEAGAAVTEQNWGAWAASVLLWWVALFVALSVLVLMARIATFGFVRQKAVKEASLAAAGRCPFCGYDLRGLEFSERCPECGELQH